MKANKDQNLNIAAENEQFEAKRAKNNRKYRKTQNRNKLSNNGSNNNNNNTSSVSRFLLLKIIPKNVPKLSKILSIAQESKIYIL